MNPNPTELEKLQPRKKIIRHSPLYLLAMIVYFIGDDWVRGAVGSGKPVTAWIAAGIAASAALGFWFWLGERDMLKNEDELAQRIRLEALANALPFTIGLSVLLMQLDRAGVRLELTPNSRNCLWLALLVPYAITTLLARRRYR